MFDAWQNGGLVDGKKVDDDRILAYIKQRRDGFSTEDPLWDEWNNRHIQYRHTIGEQKIHLAFRQGKVGAGAVAAFYRNALKDVPRDSAFYRDLASRAAQWAQSAGSAARGRARGRATAGLRQKLNAQLEMQQNYLQLEAALTEYARREGIISGTQTLADADATDLMGMFEAGIYSGEDQITLDDFRSAAQDHYGALTSEIKTRQALGQQAVEARNKRTRFLNGTVVRLNVVDERAQYEMAREDWLSNVEAAQGNPWAIQSANEKYLTALQGIHTNASANTTGVEANDPEFIGGLANEYTAIATGESKGKTVADLYDLDDAAGSGEDQAAATQQLMADIEAIDSGAAYFGQSEPGGAFGVTYWPPGMASAMGADDSLQPSVTNVNGQKRVVWMKGQAVSASTVIDVESGQPVDLASLDAGTLRNGLASGALLIETSGEVGYVFTTPEGKTKYGVRDQVTGQMLFTDENPWTSDPTLVGENLSVFTAGRQTARGDWVPDVSMALAKTPSLTAGFDPLLADGTVTPRDMLRLAEAGLKDFAPEDVAAYQQRLQQQERERITNATMQSRTNDQMVGFNAIGRSERQTTGGGGDLRGGILEGMTNIRDVTQRLFGSPDRSKDDLYVPPPPPAPPPTVTPKPTTKLTDKSSEPFDSDFGRQPPTGVTITDRGEEGRGGGGTWGDGRGMGGKWTLRKGDPTAGSGMLGGGGR